MNTRYQRGTVYLDPRTRFGRSAGEMTRGADHPSESEHCLVSIEVKGDKSERRNACED